MTQVLDSPPTTLPARQGGGNGSNSVPQSALAAMAHRYHISESGLADVIKKTCIQGANVTDAEFKAFVIVANQYRLNPLTREIHAFADPRRGIVPIVGIDGWSRIVNSDPAFDGCDFEEVESGDDIGMTCTMHVKGRGHPIRITEWLSECRRNTPPWNTMRRRMLRHKTYIQAARIAFSIGGIYDEDEARDIVTNGAAAMAGGTKELNARITSRPVDEGQTFEPTPDAIEQAAAESASQPEEPEAQLPDVPKPEPSPHEKFMIQACELADSVGLPQEQLYTGLKKWVLKLGKKGKEHEITDAERRPVLDAIRTRSGYFAG